MRRAFIDDDRLLAGGDPSQGIVLPAAVAFRFARVLRLQQGEAVELFDASGRVARGTFEPPDRMVDVVIAVVDDGLPPVLVVQALTRTDKLEWVAAKATELGASRLILWSASRAVVKLDDERGDKKVARLQRVAADAARLRAFGAGSDPAPGGEGGLAVAGIVDADVTLSVLCARERVRLQRGFAIVIGPEGGIAPAEEDAFVDAGVHGVRFSRFILRTETAALAALAIAQAGLGEA